MLRDKWRPDWRSGAGWRVELVAMLAGSRNSLSGRLRRVVVSTTAIAVWVAGLAMLTHDLAVYRTSWAADLSNEAAILALSTAPALAFDDHAAAQTRLDTLHARSHVLCAAIYSERGSLYAEYARPGEPPPRKVPAITGVRIDGERVEVEVPVVRDAETLGTLYLRARYDVFGRVTAYLGIFGLVMLLSLAAAIVFSTRLQRAITEPLDAMVLVARQIVTRRDYSLRASQVGVDEISVVVAAFNNMLDEIQRRTRAIEQSNLALKEEIAIRKATEAALGVATARLESTMAAAEIGSWIWDLRQQYFTADRNLASLYGLASEAELNGDPARHHRAIHALDIAAVIAAESEALATGILAPCEFRVALPGGSERWLVRRGKLQCDADGQPLFLSGLCIDITDQKRAAQALRQSEQLYRAIGESIRFGVWVCDRTGRNLYASESFLALTGLSSEQCANVGWIDRVHPDDAAETAAAWQACVREGAAWYREYRILGADGAYHPILAQGSPILGEDGRPSGWAGIHLDIARLKQSEDALREADRRKDEFLATLAHELRNPLAPIRHAVKLLEAPRKDGQQQDWARAVIARQVHRMGLLLEDLLDVSRITRGRLDLKIEAVALRVVVDAAIETARPLLDEKHQRFEVELPAESVTLAVDALRISQSLANLLTNACKYTDAGGRIVLSALLTPDGVVFRVTDSGIGMHPSAIPGVFQMFSQVDPAIARAQGGLGIGLALVKGLIAMHGGTVEAESAGVGQGSEFTIHLPRAVIVSCSGAPAAADVRPSAAARSRRTVLIADDNRDAADTLAMVLEMTGYETMVAHSGSEALEVAVRRRPDAAILDIGMPDMTGYEVARRLRREVGPEGMFLVAVTGWGKQEDKQQATDAGFDEHRTKPVDPDELVQLLARFLESRDIA